VDRLKDKVMGALEQKRSSQNTTHTGAAATGNQTPATSAPHEEITDSEKITDGAVEMGEASLELEQKYTSAFEAWGCETSRTVEMLKQLQQGLVTQKEQQEKVRACLSVCVSGSLPCNEAFDTGCTCVLYGAFSFVYFSMHMQQCAHIFVFFLVQLVQYWLGQHQVMKGELELMLNMANAASEVSTLSYVCACICACVRVSSWH
jgi:hypothetical protein